LLVSLLGLLTAPLALAADPTGHGAAAASGRPAAESTLDRSTPRKALQSFLASARDGDFSTAARCLDLRGASETAQGPELAEQLSYVMYRRPPIDLASVPDDPTAHDGQVIVDTLPAGEQEVPLTLARVKADDGTWHWLVAHGTVRHIPDVAAALHPSSWVAHVPKVLCGPVVFGNAPWQWLGMIVGLLAAYTVGRLAAALLVRIATPFVRRTATTLDDTIVEAARRPLRTILASVLFGALVDELEVSLTVTRALHHAAYTGVIVGVAWLSLATFALLASGAAAPRGAGELHPDTAGDRTRRALLRRVASAAVVGVAAALVLLQFDVVRHVGLSLLASAGIASVVVGLAAQKSLAGVIAGIQLSISQPVRLGDTVFIEGEVGTVQDIYLTYAVIRLIDDRCVVVPVSRFLDHPFQNWTLLQHDFFAFTTLYVDFKTPVGALRERARALCQANPMWDGKRCEVHVSDSTNMGLVLRVAVSARSPRDLWELQCAVREGLYEHLARPVPASA
jgi:small-conductance mechanosensitive channel